MKEPTFWDKKKNALNEAFSPSSPILAKDFFFGRLSQIDEVVDSINERGQYVIVYGERGVGKTSFSNIGSSGNLVRDFEAEERR